jgi:predicted dehydrogenase
MDQSNIKPLRLAFLGTGWIGRDRMQALISSGLAEAVAIADPTERMREEALVLAPQATPVETLAELLAFEPDGVVIATPSAMHAAQAIEVLQRGIPVFCQKPLGRNAAEVAAVLAAARSADKLLGVDFSYRKTRGIGMIHDLLRQGELGRIYSVDLQFHNAYGPDKDWFFDRTQSGGGCVMDLGVHLVDLALWLLDCRDVTQVHSVLYSGGEPLAPAALPVEDYALAEFRTSEGQVVRLACSWKAHAGCDAVIRVDLQGTEGGATFSNIAGSFYDFEARRHRSTATELLAGPPEDWGGKAAIAWVRQLLENPAYDAEADRFLLVAQVLDRIYSGH